MEIKQRKDQKVLREEERAIVRAFEVDLEPVISIAKRYEVTRAYIYKILKYNGVDTTKSGSNARQETICRFCGATIIVTRGRLRQKKNIYCSNKCWLNHLKKIRIGKTDRYGGMIGRETVRMLWKGLTKEMVVHHVDGDEKNNHVSNLLVYATQGDHLRAHRGYPATPVWVGAEHIDDWQKCLDLGLDFRPLKELPEENKDEHLS